MNPEQVREQLAREHAVNAADEGRAPGESGPPAPGARASRADDDLYKSISKSYFRLRRGLAILAFGFPILLWIGVGIDDLQASISAYYHYAPGEPQRYGAGDMRNVFVGVLWAVGCFLYFYKGYSKKEDWALDLAGAAALAVALFPMDWPTRPDVVRSVTATLHYASAILFFLAIAYVCIFRSRDTLDILDDAVLRRRFKRTYSLLGILMVALPVVVVLIHLLTGRPDRNYFVLGIEVAGIWVFSAYWLIKSREIALIERGEKSVPPQAPS